VLVKLKNGIVEDTQAVVNQTAVIRFD